MVIDYINCKADHTHNLLVMNTYHTDLYVSWSLEMVYRLAKVKNAKCWYLDLATFLPDKQMSYFSRIRRLLFFPKGFGPSFREIATKHGAKIPNVTKRDVFFSFIRSMRKFALYLIVIFTSKTPEEFLTNSRVPLEIRKSAHSTVGGYLRSVNYLPFMHPVLLLRTMLSFSLSANLVDTQLIRGEFCQVVVGNGRLVNPAGALFAARSLGVATLIIERGAKPGMLDTYVFSPHSKIERRNQLDTLWETTQDKNRIAKAEEYLHIRKKQDPISGIAWQRNMLPGLIPNWSTEFSLCFFTTTELEFAVFGDPLSKGEFETQLEAIISLAQNLNPTKWTIFVRRHPYPGKKPRFDPEARVWSQLSRFQNIKIIEPDSQIDSYELGNAVDIAAHFDSSIGPELIFEGKTPVITMGPTSWEEINSKYIFRSADTLSEEKLLSLDVRPTRDIYKWAFYMATFGESFKIIDWERGKGFYMGDKLFSNFVYRMRKIVEN